MSEWNLSVRLTGQGSDLATTLKESAKEARKLTNRINEAKQALVQLRAEAANGLTIRLDIDGAHLRDDVNTALTTAGSNQGLRVRLDIDGAHLRDDVSAALSTAGANQGLRVRLSLDADHLRDDVNAALTAAGSGQGLGVSLRLADTMQLRREVDAAVRWAAWGHRITIPIGLSDPMQLRRDVTAAVRWAQTNQTINLRVVPDTSALNNLGQNLNRGGGGGGGGGLRKALMGLLLLSPAAIPLVAGLSTALAPLPGQFSAAAVPAIAFGAAIAGQIEPLTAVADAETKYQDAVREHGQASAEAITAQIKYQQLLADLPPDTQRAAVALSQLKTNFKAWSDDMAGFTMTPLANGITVLDELIPRLTPHVQTGATQLQRLIAVAGGAVQTPGFDAMAGRFSDFTDRQLDAMTDKVMHFLRVLSEGGAIRNGPLGEFMAYAKENGPEAREAISAISDAVVTLIRGAAEAGPGMLTLVTAAAQLVAALPPELVGIILQVAAGLKLVQLAGAGAAAIAGGIATVGARIAALRTASAAAGGGVAGLAAAFGTLGTAAKATLIASGIGILLIALSQLSDMGKQAPPDVDKLTTSLRTLADTGKVTGEAARSFGTDLSGFADALQKVTDPKGLDQVQQSIVSFFGTDSTPVKEAKENIDAVDQALASLVKSGQADLAADALDNLISKMKAEGFSADEIRSQLDNYKSALADQAFEQKMAAESMGLFGAAAQETQAKLDAQKQSADGLRQSIVALNDVNRAAGSAMSAFEESLDAATAATKEHAGALKMRDGDLDLGTEKSREAEKVLSDLAADTDAAATAAREQGRSWEYVQGIMTRGQATFVDTATQMGLTKEQAEALARSYLKIPDSKTTTYEMRTEDAIAGLDSVIAAIQKTPGKKTVTVDALTADAVGLLQDLGFKVTRLPNGKFQVTADTQAAKARLADVQAARDALKNKTITIEARDRASAAVRDIQAAIAGLRNRTVTITTVRQTIARYSTDTRPTTGQGGVSKYGAGAVVDYYADGGIQRGGIRHFATGAEQHVAQFAQAGTWRVWAEPETGGEAYIPLADSKRPRSRRIAEETVRRLGGDPRAIQWNADGNITDWRYDPVSGSLYSPSEAGAAGHKTRKVKVKGKGGKTTVKEVEYFDLRAVERRLVSTSKATASFNRNLEKVAELAGGDVAQALASMGKDGVEIARKMATGSKKYIAQMSVALRDLQKTARATLGDYAVQLNHATGNQELFAKNLATLAGRGYGDLAGQLAAQNDQAAMELAAAAVRDKKKAGKANTAAKRANQALTSDQVADLVQIIAAISSNKVGIHDVAAKTGLGEDVIIAVANKAKSQISSSLGGKATKFLADLGKANKHLAYADGGIRAGMYATSNGIIRFAEPSTGGEAYLPLSPSKRRHAMPVLADVAHRFGVGLTDARAARPVVIVQGGGDTHVTVTPVRTGATASDIGAQVGRSVRRARRGGVAARAAGTF